VDDLDDYEQFLADAKRSEYLTKENKRLAEMEALKKAQEESDAVCRSFFALSTTLLLFLHVICKLTRHSA